MKLAHRTPTTHPTAAPANANSRRSNRRTALARCLTPLCIVAVLCTAALQASADTDTAIYLYVNGSPVNVTATCSVKTNHVYDESGNLIGTVNGSDQIVDGSGDVLGYIQISGT